MNSTIRFGTAAATALAVSALLAGATALVGCAETTTVTGDAGLPAQATRTTSLPADFPRARVPLIAGTVVAASGDAAHGWTVAVAPARGQDVATATHLLAAAGYLTQSERLGPARFAGPAYDVRLTDAGGTVLYAVRLR